MPRFLCSIGRVEQGKIEMRYPEVAAESLEAAKQRLVAEYPGWDVPCISQCGPNWESPRNRRNRNQAMSANLIEEAMEQPEVKAAYAALEWRNTELIQEMYQRRADVLTYLIGYLAVTLRDPSDPNHKFARELLEIIKLQGGKP